MHFQWSQLLLVAAMISIPNTALGAPYCQNSICARNSLVVREASPIGPKTSLSKPSWKGFKNVMSLRRNKPVEEVSTQPGALHSIHEQPGSAPKQIPEPNKPSTKDASTLIGEGEPPKDAFTKTPDEVPERPSASGGNTAENKIQPSASSKSKGDGLLPRLDTNMELAPIPKHLPGNLPSIGVQTPQKPKSEPSTWTW